MHFFKSTKPFVQVIVLLLLWLMMTIVASGIVAVASAMGVDVKTSDNLLWLQLLSQLVGFVLPAVLFAWLFYGDERNYFQFRFSSSYWGKALVAAVVFLLLVPVIEWLTIWNDGWHLPESMASLETTMRDMGKMSEQVIASLLMQSDVWHLVCNLVVIALCPAICEELFFRGALQQVLARGLRSPHWAIIIAAAIFSLAHFDMFAFVPRFAMGVVLGYCYYLSGSMIVNVCAHFVNNAVIVVLYYLYSNGLVSMDPSVPNAMPLYLVALTLLAAAALFYIYFIPKQGREANE
ncbi:MAG: CPBP family intramembrane metalloprotease [Bacteroidales bacterium]|nr:CPBP family intramembrane metalloprotease [Bacteroidales bacterium]